MAFFRNNHTEGVKNAIPKEVVIETRMLRPVLVRNVIRNLSSKDVEQFVEEFGIYARLFEAVF